ncbi:DUF2958 domain-containing protein (plasmid) [Agrobacterium leguminum]|uniref:DUF2958 domain-containing protein n=1 Tax=Agrobacterium leguminum TaxID=2792015 RepID=UPI0010C99E57|nr:DUF2958 domain-containing protein [Agrobacterium leguminum]WFS69546.1 DUF2958 domain-containing protein [Agrobacterium leguminum]
MTLDPAYELIPAVALDRLKANFRKNLDRRGADLEPVDFRPVLKLWMPTGRAIWLVTEYDEAEDCLFGLCDTGQGSPELGYVSLEELKTYVGPCGVHADRDCTFLPSRTLSEYAADARARGYIETYETKGE